MAQEHELANMDGHVPRHISITSHDYKTGYMPRQADELRDAILA